MIIKNLSRNPVHYYPATRFNMSMNLSKWVSRIRHKNVVLMNSERFQKMRGNSHSNLKTKSTSADWIILSHINASNKGEPALCVVAMLVSASLI